MVRFKVHHCRKWPDGQVAVIQPPPMATIQVDPILALNAEFIGAMLDKIVEWAGEDSGARKRTPIPRDTRTYSCTRNS